MLRINEKFLEICFRQGSSANFVRRLQYVKFVLLRLILQIEIE